MSNIVDVVVADKNLATMLRGVKAAGLETELSKTGPYTVFAPSEIAFGKMAQGELDVKVSNGNVTINGAAIQGRYKDATNGVVHSLDAVIAVN